MAKKGRKPIPKTQKELSISKQTSYLNSNSNDNNIEKRANKLSLDDDKSSLFNIGLEDIDGAVLYYFQNVIKPYVVQNNQRISVPIIYGSPEKWKTAQRDGYYKDKNGTIMLPLIVLKKGPISKIRNITNKQDANNPNNLALLRQTYSKKNIYDNFSILNGIKPEVTNHVIVVPDYLKIGYSCMISTYYVSQLNKIIESIEYASDSYWGEKNKFQFKTYVDTFNPITEINTNGERIVKCNFDLTLTGYIIPDVYQKNINSIKKYNIPNKITINVNEQE